MSSKIQEKGSKNNSQQNWKEPESDIIRVSNTRHYKSYKLSAKLILKKFSKIQIQGLNSSANSVIALANWLEVNKYAKIKKIESDKIVTEGNNSQENHQALIFVVNLEKTKEFDSLFTDLN